MSAEALTKFRRAAKVAANSGFDRSKVLIDRQAPYIVAGGTWQEMTGVFNLELCSLERLLNPTKQRHRLPAMSLRDRWTSYSVVVAFLRLSRFDFRIDEWSG